MERREFLKKSSILFGSLGISTSLHPTVRRIMNIEPNPGSTFYDAEHVVILMQENRSFDHCFGTLKGVRGFNDPHAFTKPDGLPVFLQETGDSEYAAPFHLDIKNTKATWMKSLPHTWADQIDARNGGKFDRWIPSKRSGIAEYSEIPLTMGYYNRQDIPFYYQFADAFTIFDQYFCSSLTGTSPNRSFLWTGTIRDEKNGDSHAHVYNDELDYGREAGWRTFPEILEKNKVSWKVYQNETGLPKGLGDDENAYIGNFGDNILEIFSQYNVKFSPGFYDFAKKRISVIKKLLEKDQKNNDLINELKFLETDLEKYHPGNLKNLSEFEQEIHKKAFTTNSGDPDFHNIEELEEIGGEKMFIPKGDILHQFRQDVKNDTLPTVSWLVAPEKFSDHPSAPWYGAWYISEALNILSENPEVWKKTIFILNYDENDGYFDHQIPFSPPDNPSQSPNIHGEEGADFVDYRQDYFKNNSQIGGPDREGPVGLGYRVPMVVASPWSKGGFVNSEVSDHTSVLMFLEKFLGKKTGKDFTIDNISNWRRNICGDLTSAFRKPENGKIAVSFLDEGRHIHEINAAKLKPIPKNYSKSKNHAQLQRLVPRQETGIKPAYALPYDFEVNFSEGAVTMQNFGKKAAPLTLYDRLNFGSGKFYFPYALYTGNSLMHKAPESKMDLEIYGPNGFFRSFKGESGYFKNIRISASKTGKTAEILLESDTPMMAKLRNTYAKTEENFELSGTKSLVIDISKFGGWYGVEIISEKFMAAFAGHFEDGKASVTDPKMGGLLEF